MLNPDSRPIVVLGLGNMLMTDDGIGLAALARLQDEWFIPPGVDLVDGGTWGMNLLPVIESAHRLLVLDAIDHGREPGTLLELRDAEVRTPVHFGLARQFHKLFRTRPRAPIARQPHAP